MRLVTTGWEAESAHTARALARLVGAGYRSGMDLDVAIAARAAVLDTVADVFGDIAPWYRNLGLPREPPGIDLAELDPVRAFALVLRRRGRVHLDRSPSQLVERGLPVDATSSAWATAGRHAILARRAWPDGAAASLDSTQCWRAVGQAAALAEAVAVLDTDLTAAGVRPDLAAVIGTTAGLRVAAREVLGLAAHAAPVHPATPRRDPTRPGARAPRRLVPERAGRQPDLARAVGRLTSLIDRAEFLTPDQVRGGARVARNLAVLAAGGAVDPGGQLVRAELGALARTLHAVATEPRTEATLITAARPPALDLHLRELNRDSRAALAARQTATSDPDLATRVARRLPDLVTALDRKARAQVDANLWAILDRREGEHPLYAIASLRDPGREPPLLGRLRDAAGAATAVGERVNPPDGDQLQLVGPRERAARTALRHAVADRLQVSRPPAHPAGPMHGLGGPDPGGSLAR